MPNAIKKIIKRKIPLKIHSSKSNERITVLNFSNIQINAIQPTIYPKNKQTGVW